jgi:hypothetical protein
MTLSDASVIKGSVIVDLHERLSGKMPGLSEGLTIKLQ